MEKGQRSGFPSPHYPASCCYQKRLPPSLWVPAAQWLSWASQGRQMAGEGLAFTFNIILPTSPPFPQGSIRQVPKSREEPVSPGTG